MDSSYEKEGYSTTIGVVDGMAWFEDGTSVDSMTVELIAAAPELLDLAREVAGVAETVAALLCSPGEATKAELVSVITDLGAKAAALVNDATKEEA